MLIRTNTSIHIHNPGGAHDMKRKKPYIFTNKRHSPKGVFSAVLGLISLISLIVVIYLSYMNGGAIPISYGLTGLLVAFYSVTGFILSIKTLQDREIYRFFPILGIITNFLSLAGVSLILYTGTS
jgi:ABC-type transport system involved in cytochrome c biogenesis permease subunit